MSLLFSWVSLFLPPVNGKVVVPYKEPACFYCAGHRGVVVAVADGAPVRAIADGTITFAGEVAGVTYVVLGFAPDLRLTYGYLLDRLTGEGEIVREIQTGDVVSRGQVLGHSSQRVYLGVREGTRPRNPVPFLGVRRSRLVSPGSPTPLSPALSTGSARKPTGGGIAGWSR